MKVAICAGFALLGLLLTTQTAEARKTHGGHSGMLGGRGSSHKGAHYTRPTRHQIGRAHV